MRGVVARWSARFKRLRARPARGTLAPTMTITATMGILLATAAASLPARSSAAADAPAPLGITYAGWKGDYRAANKRLETFKSIGFQIVSFVPTYAYVGLDKIDLAAGPDAAELGAAVESALRGGFTVVIKPHLDPPAYQPGFDPFKSENDSWRVMCPWRGFYDLDPMAADYREGVVFATMRMLKEAIERAGQATPAPVRLEVGAELMNSVVYGPERWEQLLAAAKKERRRLGLDGKVALSHNFTHHLEIPDDFVNRMTAPRKKALGRYIRGLDVLSLSQYMDLTAAMPPADRGTRLPSAEEVAQALRQHEQSFRRDILIAALGLKDKEIPPLHIGEFGVGRGGLRHPNLWAGAATAEQEKQLAREIARGHEGLLRYLATPEGRTVKSAVLWVLGQHYDVFGWENPKYGNPEAAAAIKGALHAAAPLPAPP
jgi:hypothetical protein